MAPSPQWWWRWGSTGTGSQPRAAWPYKGRSQGGLLTQAWRENPDSHCLFSPSQPPGASQEGRGSPVSASRYFLKTVERREGKLAHSLGATLPACHQPAPGKNLPYKRPRPPVRPSPLTEGIWSHREGKYLGEVTTPAGDRAQVSQVAPHLLTGDQEPLVGQVE